MRDELRASMATDLVGEPAIQLAHSAYLRARMEDRPESEIDDLRELICLAGGWKFRR